MSNAQSALAEATETFGRIDILLCNTSEGKSRRILKGKISQTLLAVVGSVEELSTCAATLDLVRRQFEVIFFGQINFIKAILPLLREKHNGHIIMLTAIHGHIGTPGMPMYSASTWALEGFCDSLAYEIAPFNIKMTIVQPNMEINVLSNARIDELQAGEKNKSTIVSRFPKLPAESIDRLVMETVHALTAIGGHAVSLER
jgi:NAD(P)-dependent dehydrogenase (short-subunit alcohol dehydrogenase family)